MTSALSEVNPHREGRFCRTCGQSLVGVTLRRCPECGRGYDPDDPRTTAGPRRGLWESSGPFAHAMVGVGVIAMLACLGVSVTGRADPLIMLGCGVVLLGPVLVGAVVLASIPDVPMRPWVRVLGIGSAVILVSVVLTHWPLVLSFHLHRSGLERAADVVALRGAGTGPGGVGLWSFRRVAMHDANVGFQLTGDAGGGTFLVRRGPGATRVWTNTNWEIPLGGDWFWVYED